jgi:putative hydroxymethylpyrimidine transport system ATP-binding protein
MTDALSTAPSIYFEDFNLSFHGQVFFKNFNWELAAGKFTCLLGPSGVGKTTILRAIANILDRDSTTTSGKIYASDGQPIASRISYMAQTDLLMPWLTALENALLGFRLRKEVTKTVIAQAKDLFGHMNLTAALDKYPVQLSGGMRQRTALVRTLLENKPILLMDEPFSSVDAITRNQLQNLAADVLKNKTVLLVTHDPLEALRLADVIYVLTNTPAVLSAPIYPPKESPRDIADAKLLNLHQQLLRQLEQTIEVAA